MTLFFQTRVQGVRKSNWLPAPKGRFNLTMRLYSPKSDALTGKWNPPPITKIRSASSPMVSEHHARALVLPVS